jgi:hypothetical protein
MGAAMDMQALKKHLDLASPAFEAELTAKTTEAREFAEVLQLCTPRKQLHADDPIRPRFAVARLRQTGTRSSSIDGNPTFAKLIRHLPRNCPSAESAGAIANCHHGAYAAFTTPVNVLLSKRPEPKSRATGLAPPNKDLFKEFSTLEYKGMDRRPK